MIDASNIEPTPLIKSEKSAGIKGLESSQRGKVCVDQSIGIIAPPDVFEFAENCNRVDVLHGALEWTSYTRTIPNPERC